MAKRQLSEPEYIGAGSFQRRQVWEFQHAAYQRLREGYRIRRIAANFDSHLFGVLVGSQRAGHLWTLDGGHRLEALTLMGKVDALVPVWVYEDLSYQEEARIYRTSQDPNYRKSLTTGERFQARLEEGDLVATQVKAIIDQAQVPLDLNMRVAAARALRSIATFEKVYRRSGAQVAADTLGVLSQSWSEETNTYHQYLINGTAAFLNRYPEADVDRLIQSLRTHTPRQVIFRAGQISESINSAMGTAVGRAMLAMYNEVSRGGRLPDWGALGSRTPEVG